MASDFLDLTPVPVRRLPWRHLAAASLLAGAPVLAAGTAGAVPPPAGGDSGSSLKLSVDVAGSGMGNMLSQSPTDTGIAIDPAGNIKEAPKDSSKQINLGGIPLTVATKDADGRGMTAGANGQYIIPLLDNLSLVNRGSFQQVQSLDRSGLGATTANGGPELLYKNGGTLIGLQPDLGVQMDNATLNQLSYGLNSRVSRDLIGGLNASASTSYALQSTADGNNRVANGTAGLTYTFPSDVKMGLAYIFQRSLAESDGSVSGKQGPSISATVPIGSTLNLGATYAYTRNDSVADLERMTDSAQTMGLSAGWDVGAPIGADVKVKANYDYTRDTSATSGSRQGQHAATVGMDMKF